MSQKIETKSPPTMLSTKGHASEMGAKFFQNEQAMSDYQVSRELKEALRVQFMSPEERFRWLKEAWGHLQDGSSFLFAQVQIRPGAARCYNSLDEKNRFEEGREIKWALELSVYR